MKPITTALILGLTLNAAFAQDDQDWYEVELLVFKYMDASAIAGEYWPTAPGEPDWQGTRFLSGDDNTARQGLPKAYALLPDSLHQLSSARNRMARNPAYRPLIHLAWRQVIPPRQQPDRIYLTSDPTATPTTRNAPAPHQPIRSHDVDMNTMAADFTSARWASPGDIPELEGIFTVGRGRYLHVNLDMVWTPREQDLIPEMSASIPPAPSLQEFGDFDISPIAYPATAPPRQFHIQASRRMRSGEIHYLDHPMISILALFTPYTPPEPEPEINHSTAEILPVTTPITTNPAP